MALEHLRTESFVNQHLHHDVVSSGLSPDGDCTRVVDGFKAFFIFGLSQLHLIVSQDLRGLAGVVGRRSAPGMWQKPTQLSG